MTEKTTWNETRNHEARLANLALAREANARIRAKNKTPSVSFVTKPVARSEPPPEETHSEVVEETHVEREDQTQDPSTNRLYDLALGLLAVIVPVATNLFIDYAYPLVRERIIAGYNRTRTTTRDVPVGPPPSREAPYWEGQSIFK
jgi:hypothetical protein